MSFPRTRESIFNNQHWSKNISEIPIDKIDLVVTLCGDAAENCPIFPGKIKKIHWEIEDPAKAKGSEEKIAKVFRKVRDNIRSLIISYLFVQ